jgi:hypothetical protein
MRVQLYWLAGSLLLIAAFTGCGTPGAPQPPSLQLARPVDDLTASRKGNRVKLDWTVQRSNTDRTLVKHLPAIRICRREGTGLMSTCDVVAEVPPANTLPQPKKKQEELPAIRMQYVDSLPPQLGQENSADFVTYAVEEINSHGRSAGLSNQVPIPVAPTISPPDELSAQVSGEGVRISWTGPASPDAPAGLSYRYRIVRKPVGAPSYIVLTDVEPVAIGSYLDKTFEWEQKYEYRITTLTQVDAHGISTAVEGDDSNPVEVFTRDIYPPAQPAGLQAVFSSVGQKTFIDLTWAPNLESDLAGYNVFRRVEGGQFEKLNKQLVTTSSFRDENVEPGKKYIYAVSAADLRGNVSQRSAEASETVPDK